MGLKMADFSFSDLSKHLSFGQQQGIGLPKNPNAFGNWQTYVGQIASPASFGQFQDYSGIGGVAPMAAEKSPVAPTFAQVKERFGQVSDQLKQGNIVDALKTYQYGPASIAPVVQQQQPAQQNETQDDMMSSEFGG
jgi:hypothetical protein